MMMMVWEAMRTMIRRLNLRVALVWRRCDDGKSQKSDAEQEKAGR